MSDTRIKLTDLPEGHPPLMVFSDRIYSASALARIREQIVDCAWNNKPMLFEPELRVYQMVDGQWRPILQDETST